MMTGLAWAAFNVVPRIPNPFVRAGAWMLYGFTQGLVCTGLWTIAHECGHGAIFTNRTVNDIVGWVLHSFILVPYFSWKFSHQRHHRFTSHITKDPTHVPPTRTSLDGGRHLSKADLEELLEETPGYQFGRLVLQQLLGWPAYVLFNVSAGRESLQRESKGGHWLHVSHLDPTSPVFRRSEAFGVVMSDVGLGVTLCCLYWCAKAVGFSNILLLYFMPFLWINHWLGEYSTLFFFALTGAGLVTDRT